MTTVAITRVVNATVLLELPGGGILTDPYFHPYRFLRLREAVGLTVAELPRLAAIIGGHGVLDHWQPRALRTYPYRDVTPVIVATRAMARSARRAGFTTVHQLGWGGTCELSGDLTVTSLPGERITGMLTNSYLLSSPGGSIFVGTEARSLAPIRAAAAEHQVDLALLPIDGTRLFGRRLVMDATAAIQAAHLLGAHTLVPIHYALRGLLGLLRCPSGPHDLAGAAIGGTAVRLLPTGQRTTITLASATPPR